MSATYGRLRSERGRDVTKTGGRYLEAIASSRPTSASVEVWEDGRVGVAIRDLEDGRVVFEVSYYPAAVQTDGRPAAVFIDRGAELVRQP